ncbi:M1-family alanyl aminopeptidase, putative [Plasmodium gaboni]|uniref:M1-family alanyl aminopeptidase, putative n=1 Tax=Plasmodium gaboni TaxID=647221 RepID=A0ABY1UVR8_9APIC|nr:M1-family alanyl aminopeptidase, putative [Plasmodium gaboni]
MKTKQLHLYHLGKNLNLNKNIKPLKYKVHLIFLKLYPHLRYYGYCVIYFLKLSKCFEKKISVYLHGEYLRVLKCFYICPCNIERRIRKEDIYKRNEYIDIYLKNCSLSGLYKLVIWFCCENIEKSIEGIYVSHLSKEGIREEPRNKIRNKNLFLSSLDSVRKNYIQNIFERRNRFYFEFENDKNIRRFHFKNICFEDEKNYNYISTFCEFYYLANIFPCLQDNNDKVCFSLSVSFQIKLIDSCSFYNNKIKLDNGIFCEQLYNYMNIEELYVKKRKKESKKGVLYNKYEEKKKKNLKNKKYLYSNYDRFNILRPSLSVVSNSKIKNVYINKRISRFNSFRRNKKFLIKKLLFQCSNKWKHGKYNNSRVIEKKCGYKLRNHFIRYNNNNNNKIIKKEKKKNRMITNKYILNNYHNKCYSKKRNKKFLTYKFYNTNKILHYNFCLFIGIYNRIYFKLNGIDIYIYFEKGNNNFEKIRKSYEYFLDLLIYILHMYMKNHNFKREIKKNGFLQFMIVRNYKYSGEENANCLTFLERFILINKTNRLYDIYKCIRLLVHEIFHIIWGNSIYIKKKKNLWLKEGLARMIEYKLSYLILKRQVRNLKKKNKINSNNHNNINNINNSCSINYLVCTNYRCYNSNYRCYITNYYCCNNYGFCNDYFCCCNHVDCYPCSIRRDMYIIILWNILNSFFYIHIIDTLNTYNHSVHIGYKKCDKKGIRSKKEAKKYNHKSDKKHKSYRNKELNCVLNIKECINRMAYTKTMNYFYNNITYNKGMNIFKMIYILCYPFYNIIMDLLFFTFYNYSITFKKILIFIQFFFYFFDLKPWFVLSSDKYCVNRNNMKKVQGVVIRSKYIKCISRYFKKRKKNIYFSGDNKKKILSYRSCIKWEYLKNKKKNYNNTKHKYDLSFYKNEYFENCWSNFLKVSFKRYFLQFYKIICTMKTGEYKKKQKKNNQEKKKNNQKCRYLKNKVTPLYNKTSFLCSLFYARSHINKELLKSFYERNIFDVILRNYINVVAPPKIFFKYLKEEKKLLIMQKHFYYDNNQGRFIETPILFHIPLIFTFNNKKYKILLNKKSMLIDCVNLQNKTGKKIAKCRINLNLFNKKIKILRRKRPFLNIEKCDKFKATEKKQNSLILRYKDGGYFSFHCEDMYTFRFLINGMEGNKYNVYDIHYVFMNIILQYLKSIKTLKEAKRLNSLILRQILKVISVLWKNSNYMSRSIGTAKILFMEFLRCYMFFSPCLKKIENKKLTLKIKEEIKRIEYNEYVEKDDDLFFLFNDIRKNLYKIIFYFKQSMNLCS